jgi:hypothetical protein
LREFLASTGSGYSDAPAEPVAPAEPQMSVEALPDAAPEPDAFEQYLSSSQPQQRPSSYEAPPEVQKGDNKWLWIASALDLALNQGKSLPTYVSQMAAPDNSGYENWNRRNKARNDASARDSRASGADTAELQRRRLEQAERRIDMQERGLGTTEGREERLREKYEAEHSPTSKQAQATRAYLVSQGEDPSLLEGLSDVQMRSGLNTAQRQAMEVAMADQTNEVAADRARGVAQATEGSKLRVAEGTARVTHPYKVNLARETAGIRTDDKVTQAALDETKTVNTERRKRAGLQEEERTKLNNLLAQLDAREDGDRLPGQGNIASRGAIAAKAKVLGGTGMDEADSVLDNELTMAGLVAYVSEGHNAPNSEREQEVAGRKFRGDGTVAGAKAAIRARLAAIEQAESSVREREEQERIRPSRPRAAPRSTPAATVPADDLEF